MQTSTGIKVVHCSIIVNEKDLRKTNVYKKKTGLILQLQKRIQKLLVHFYGPNSKDICIRISRIKDKIT